MKIKIYTILSLFVAIILFLGFTNRNEHVSTFRLIGDEHPDVDWSISCSECHQQVTPEIYESWSESKHGQVNFGCYICHGDGQENFYAKGSDQTCINCHAGQEINFEKTNVKSCFDCHNGHTLKFHD